MSVFDMQYATDWSAVGVPVRWLVNQPELGLRLRGGSPGSAAEITFAVSTELAHPGRWLSGGELVLTTGIGVPLDSGGRRAYVRELVEAGAAAVGFGVGLSHDEIPADVIEEADAAGIALLEIPLPTPFAAVVKSVMNRLAEQQYESVVLASRAQPRMTRAAIGGGVAATVHELSVACGAPVVLLDRGVNVSALSPSSTPPDVITAVTALVRRQLATGGVPDSSVAPADSGTLVVQSIRVGRRTHGYLAAAFSGDPRPVDQVLIGHANSLLALDFEKPLRLHAEQNRVNTGALQILLTRGTDLTLAREVVDNAADESRRIRVLTVLDCPRVATVYDAVDDALTAAGRPAFLLAQDRRGGTGSLLVVLRGTDDAAFADRLLDDVPSSVRRRLSIGLSVDHDVARIEEAVEQSRMAAVSTDRCGAAVEAAAVIGRTLLAVPESRRVLDNLATVLVDPLAAYDAEHHTELVSSLRAYLEANGQWEAAATALGVHRHTLRSRVSRIEEVLGCDLGSARVRAELLLAIIARR